MAAAKDALEQTRRRMFLLGRICRIIARIEPLLTKRSVGVTVGDSRVQFKLNHDQDALDVAAALRLKIDLHWVRVYTYKQAIVETDDLYFEFCVYGIRPIHYEECVVKRAARKNSAGWRKAKLIFGGELELSELPYPSHGISRTDLKKTLWRMALKYHADGKFPTYSFHDPF
jgi:hypothetical protein